MSREKMPVEGSLARRAGSGESRGVRIIHGLIQNVYSCVRVAQALIGSEAPP